MSLQMPTNRKQQMFLSYNRYDCTCNSIPTFLSQYFLLAGLKDGDFDEHLECTAHEM